MADTPITEDQPTHPHGANATGPVAGCGCFFCQGLRANQQWSSHLEWPNDTPMELTKEQYDSYEEAARRHDLSAALTQDSTELTKEQYDAGLDLEAVGYAAFSEVIRTSQQQRRSDLMDEKPKLAALFRDDPATPEGKYLVKRRDGTVVEWPSFVLGARDPHAAAALRAYADSIEQDPDVHPDLPARLRELADEFDAYRAAHGAGDPTRGRHRRDDPATVQEMRSGASA